MRRYAVADEYVHAYHKFEGAATDPRLPKPADDRVEAQAVVSGTGPAGPLRAERRRGRPPQVSRDEIVDAAARLLREAPDAPLTMANVAGAVGVTPTALYRHFRGRDELLDALVGKILSDRNAALPHEGPWQDQLRAWIVSGLEHLIPYHQLVHLVLAGGSYRWLHDAATLARILELAGLEGDELAEVQVWIAMSFGGFVMAEAVRPRVADISQTYAALAHISPEDADRLAPLVPAIFRAQEHSHQRFADRMVLAVEALVDEARR
jgi:AcrR family transcriptional regulator